MPPPRASERAKEPAPVSDTPRGFKRPQTASNGLKRLQTASNGLKRPQTASNRFKRPQTASNGLKRPRQAARGAGQASLGAARNPSPAPPPPTRLATRRQSLLLRTPPRRCREGEAKLFPPRRLGVVLLRWLVHLCGKHTPSVPTAGQARDRSKSH